MSRVISVIEARKLFSAVKPGRVKGCGASKELTKQHFLTARGGVRARCWCWCWCNMCILTLVLVLVLTGGSLASCGSGAPPRARLRRQPRTMGETGPRQGVTPRKTFVGKINLAKIPVCTAFSSQPRRWVYEERKGNQPLDQVHSVVGGLLR